LERNRRYLRNIKTPRNLVEYCLNRLLEGQNFKQIIQLSLKFKFHYPRRSKL
jgi:hypothetical protein